MKHMKAVILAGGLGTRLREETEIKPKPMVEIGGKPILWHIMKTYSSYGVKDFVICAGYKSEVIRNWLVNFEFLNSDFTLKLSGKSEIKFHDHLTESNWTITLADTGQQTMTGGRIHKVKKYLDGESFFCTYGDGVADVKIDDLLNFHKANGRIATLTTVKPTSRFGVIDINSDNSVDHFREKPQADGWINAGYFVFEQGIFEYLNENSVLEEEPLAKLASNMQLSAFKHEGFWQPMDTYREATILNKLWDENNAPWKVWN